MTIGSALALVAVGAILRWAVTVHTSWIDVQTTGLVLFVIGLVALPLALVYTFWWADRDTRHGTGRYMPPPAR